MANFNKSAQLNNSSILSLNFAEAHAGVTAGRGDEDVESKAFNVKTVTIEILLVKSASLFELGEEIGEINTDGIDELVNVSSIVDAATNADSLDGDGVIPSKVGISVGAASSSTGGVVLGNS